MFNRAQRDPFLDNARLILVGLVVFGHMTSPLRGDYFLVYELNNFLSLFRMPALIFITGLFAKRYQKSGYLKSLALKLLVPYIIFQILFAGYYSVLYSDRDFYIDILLPEYTLWFLLSLFFWNCMLFVFVKIHWPIIFSIAISLSIGAVEQAGIYASLQRTFVFFPFFLLGFYASQEHIDTIKKQSPLISVLVFVSVFYFFISLFDVGLARKLVLGYSPYYEMGLGNYEGMVYRSLTMIFSVITAAAFLSLVPKLRLFFTHLGERSAYIYILHGAMVSTLYEFGVDDFFEGGVLLLCVLLLTLLMIFALSSRPVVNLTRPAIEGSLVTWIEKGLGKRQV